MNTRRQTVWLVSMLSLMVVLSAYYLFTDDADSLKTASEGTNTENVNMVDVTEVDGADAEANKDQLAQSVDEAAGQEENQIENEAAAQADATSDQEVLDKVAAQASTGQDFFISKQLQRVEDLSKETDRLMNIIADTEGKQDTETVSKAIEDLRNIEDKQAKFTSLEEELLKDFQDAVVFEEANKWKVVVKAEILEKSEAVSIVDKVIAEMGVTPDRVEVQVKQ